MTQDISNPLVASGKSGTVLIDDLNDLMDSLITSHSGAAAPSYVQNGLIWLKTGDGRYYARESGVDVELFEQMTGLDVDNFGASNWLMPVAAAFVNGSGASLTASTGIASMTRNSTGYYSFTFTTTQPTTALLFSGMVSINASPTLSVSNITTSGFDIKSYASGSLTDVYFSFQIHRIP